MKPERIRQLSYHEAGSGPVVYWMSRDQRMSDNWALHYAQRMALVSGVPLVVVFCLVDEFLGATIRHYGFMLRGLEKLHEILDSKNIDFALLIGNPAEEIPDFINEIDAGFLVTDFDPLRIKREWKIEVLKKTRIVSFEVDSHNIVPCFRASGKQEYSARTLRLKYGKILASYLKSFPSVKRHPSRLQLNRKISWEQLTFGLKVDYTVPEVTWINPGEQEGMKSLRKFIRQVLGNYPALRNDPNANCQSGLSPYIHFGHISAQRIALEVVKSDVPGECKDAFVEELVIRRELSDNFCYYNTDYDNPKGFPDWAKNTIRAHIRDKRDYIYSLGEFESSKTHDPLWNAAQREMVVRGKMHGFMRMYWAKKIMEWTENPATAQDIAIHLNDKYSLDGRDPNGYTGIAWSIGGLHDRPWPERNISGTVRYMNEKGCRRKFDVDRYIDKWF